MANVWSSAKILEFDYAGLEQVVMGWCMNDPAYIDTAKLGTHALVAAHELKRPPDPKWSRTDRAAYFKAIKKDEPVVYDRSKRVVHGTAYGLTPFGMVKTYPQHFPTLKIAEATQKVYFDIAPGVPKFQANVQHTAHIKRFLGGAEPYQYFPGETRQEKARVIGHPFQYKHWFWSVVSYDRLTQAQYLWRVRRPQFPLVQFNDIWYGVTLGEDAKRATAYYPQSIGRGILTEGCWPLFDPEDPLAGRCFIGDVYYGDTPLRAPIHDSLLLEVPTRKVDMVIERCAYAMQYPMTTDEWFARLPCPLDWGIGPGLVVNVEAKAGPDWGSMKEIQIPSAGELGLSTDVLATAADEEDEESILDLEVRIA